MTVTVIRHWLTAAGAGVVSMAAIRCERAAMACAVAVFVGMAAIVAVWAREGVRNQSG